MYLLRNHQTCHSDERSAVCHICKAAFKSNDSLLHHNRDCHRGSDDPTLQCSHCDKKFRQRRCLNEHVLMIHRVGRGKKLVACTKNCGAMFKRRQSMWGNLRKNQCRGKPIGDESAAEPKMEFYCPYKCGSGYRSRQSLSFHVRTRCLKNPSSIASVNSKPQAKRRSQRKKMPVQFFDEKVEVTGKEFEEIPIVLELESAGPVLDCATMDTQMMDEQGEGIDTKPLTLDIVHEYDTQVTQQLEQEYLHETPDPGETCYEIAEIYEVQELGEGVSVEGIHGEELIQTIHFETYQLSEETS